MIRNEIKLNFPKFFSVENEICFRNFFFFSENNFVTTATFYFELKQIFQKKGNFEKKLKTSGFRVFLRLRNIDTCPTLQNAGKYLERHWYRWWRKAPWIFQWQCPLQRGTSAECCATRQPICPVIRPVRWLFRRTFRLRPKCSTRTPNRVSTRRGCRRRLCLVLPAANCFHFIEGKNMNIGQSRVSKSKSLRLSNPNIEDKILKK